MSIAPSALKVPCSNYSNSGSLWNSSTVLTHLPDTACISHHNYVNLYSTTR